MGGRAAGDLIKKESDKKRGEGRRVPSKMGGAGIIISQARAVGSGPQPVSGETISPDTFSGSGFGVAGGVGL